jgi:hypothetical protein
MPDPLQNDIVAAADFFAKAAKTLLTTDGRLHAETLVLSVARMSGSLMYRSFGHDKSIAPGTTVLSDKANLQGPKLMQLMLATLQQLGDAVTEQTLNPAFASASHSPMSFRESCDRLAPFFLKYCETAPLGFQPAAAGAAVATGMLVHECAAVLPVNHGAALGVYGFIEGTKTAPFPVPRGR